MEIMKWWELGLTEEEKLFFIGTDGKSGLVRGASDWRTVEELSREANLPMGTIQAMINKFAPMGQVVQNPNQLTHWGYWQRIHTSIGESNPGFRR